MLTANNDYLIPSAFTDRGQLIARLHIEALYLKAFKSPLFVKIERLACKKTLFKRFPPKTGVTKIGLGERKVNKLTTPYCSWFNWIHGDRFNIELFTDGEGRIWLYPLDR